MTGGLGAVGDRLLERLRGMLRRGGRPPASSASTSAPSAAAAPVHAEHRVHLPGRVRWGSSPAVKHAADGSPYMTIPIDDGAAFRVMRPDSPGWWVPVHHVEAAGADRQLVPAHPWAPATPAAAAAPQQHGPPRAPAARPRRGLGWLLRLFGA